MTYSREAANATMPQKREAANAALRFLWRRRLLSACVRVRGAQLQA